MSGFNFGDAWDTDFFGNPKGGGCCVAAILIIGSLTLAGCGISKLFNKQQPTNTNPQTSRRGGFVITKNDNPTPQDVIAYNYKAQTL